MSDVTLEWINRNTARLQVPLASGETFTLNLRLDWSMPLEAESEIVEHVNAWYEASKKIVEHNQ